LHTLLAFLEYIPIYLANATSKDQFKSAFLVFEKTTFVTFLRAL
jgi:hypothetical protein